MIVEPGMMNAGIVMPDDGYLAGVKALLHARGALLAFDEVKTGADHPPRRCDHAVRGHARICSAWPSRSVAGCPAARSAAPRRS